MLKNAKQHMTEMRRSIQKGKHGHGLMTFVAYLPSLSQASLLSDHKCKYKYTTATKDLKKKA